MTLKAYRIMRRFEDWRYGADLRDLYDVFPEDFKRAAHRRSGYGRKPLR